VLKSLAGLGLAAVLASQGVSGGRLPARYVEGPLPPVPIGALGGGEVLLDVRVAADGRVTGVSTLRTTPPFAVPLINAVWRWRFQPATDGTGSPIASAVLVGASYRPPAIVGPTLGQLPVDVGRPSDDLPFPVATVTPAFPPTAAAAGTVLVEAEIDSNGRPGAVTVIRGAPPFADPARAAAEMWRFRPGRIDGVAAPTVAYLVFGFAVPVIVPAPVPGW
jgi:hypothetical protein